MGLGSYFKKLAISTDPIPVTDTTTAGQAPSKAQLFRSRLNKGANLGAMFVLEKWISGDMFADDAEGTSEYDAVSRALKDRSASEVRDQWEQHWRDWVTDDDWQWMRSVGVTAVRVPIGYWMVDGGRFSDNTEFEGTEKVYKNAWSIFKEVVLKKAEQYDIGVLVDLHGLPGGANEADHSGTCNGEAKLWESSKCQVQSFETLRFLANDLKNHDNVVGLQILNEAPHEAHDDDAQKTFYLKAAHEIREINSELPLAISDGWDVSRWVEVVKGIEEEMSTERGEVCSLGVLIDTHVYRCFSDDDKSKRPSEIINNIESAIPDTGNTVDIMVGEYSCVLDGQTWEKHDQSEGSREDLVKQYGQREAAHFSQRTAGFYFWTYKFRWGGGGEWSFRDQYDAGSLSTAFGPQDQWFPANRAPTDNYYSQAFDHRFGQAMSNHTNYWNSQDSGKDWQHWRFQDGFTQGWNDALEFDKFNHSEIGRRAAWRKSRELEHVRQKGGGELVWVWRDAFEQGVKAFLETRHYAFHG